MEHSGSQRQPLSLEERLVQVRNYAPDYLQSRQSLGGGFCAYCGYCLKEPNLADHWLGVAAWQYAASELVPHREQHAALIVQGALLTVHSELLYYRVHALRLLEMASSLGETG